MFKQCKVSTTLIPLSSSSEVALRFQSWAVNQQGYRSTPEIIPPLPGVIFKPEIHNSGYYTGPQNMLPTQTKDDRMGMETNSRSGSNQYCCQKKSLSDYTLRQGISTMLDFFLVFISFKLTHPNKSMSRRLFIPEQKETFILKD